MRKTVVRTSMIVALSAMTAGLASAQVTLPNSTQTTTLTANVSEQAQVTVPANVSFTVANVANSTAASAASVTVTSIVLATATKQLQISLKANATTFGSPNATPTWAPSDVSWNAATFAPGGGGASGVLNDNATTFTTVATCAADSSACSTTDLVFTLGPKLTVTRSGAHTLAVTWKFAAIGA